MIRFLFPPITSTIYANCSVFGRVCLDSIVDWYDTLARLYTACDVFLLCVQMNRVTIGEIDRARRMIGMAVYATDECFSNVPKNKNNFL